MLHPFPAFAPSLALAGVPGAWLAWGGLSVAVILPALAFLARAKTDATAANASLWQRLQSENGTATVEFALVMPILMFFVMMLIQISLLMVGYQFVQHAAFRAARTAIVQIPCTLGNETPNLINIGADDGKFGQIKLAAQLAVMPVCGELENAGGDQTLPDALNKYYAAYGGTSPAWVDGLLGARFAYAKQKTRVKLLQGSDGKGTDAADWTGLPELSGAFIYGPKDPVVVQVEHDMNLSVPYIRQIFQDGTQTTRAGEGGFATITTRGILVNEGIDPTIRRPNDQGQAQNGTPSPIPRIDPPTP